MKSFPRPFFFSSAFLLFIAPLAFGMASQSQVVTCQISQLSPLSRSVQINCSIKGLPAGKTTLRFADQFAGIAHLSERIHSLKVFSAQGAITPLEIRGNGLYSFDNNRESGLITVSYEMRLARALDPSQYALVSSIGKQAAVLILADLLPRACSGEGDCDAPRNLNRLNITAPENWQIATTEKKEGDSFIVADASRAVFFLAPLKTKATNPKIGEMSLRVAIAGEWSFPVEEVYSLAEAIAREQALMVGGVEKGDFLLAIAPFPQPLTGLRSSAVTIGHTVVLLLNPNDDSDQSLKHFRRHLAHELFHFYLPNAFRVRENFDWFWEGFTRYVALLTLTRLGLIDLREYLDAISEEYEAYFFNPFRLQISLIAASPEKFVSSASHDLVYHKGMLVAALYDLELRRQSRGKLNLTDALKTLYTDFALDEREIGNQEVLIALGKSGDFSRLIQDDVEGTREINLAERVKIYGLKIEQSRNTQGRERLIIAPKLSARQREIFSSLTNSRNSIR